MVLNAYLNSKNKKVKFILGHSITEPVDMIFQAVRGGTFIAPYRKHHTYCGESHYFAIVDNKDSNLQRIHKIINKNNTLYRNQPISTLLTLIGKKLFSQPLSAQKRLPTQDFFLHKPLTRREHEVLRHLSQGKTHASTANCMGIHAKTVSTHKRAAMKKLNLKRTSELFHWMLQGGLSRYQSPNFMVES